ncbi:MAG: M3 family metallopeptidase [Persephonella sp.]|nr:M3 family metallopeptidase [Persephonella sp.]
MLLLRDDLAKLLGFKNYAELSLSKKMAESPQQVISFLRELAVKSRPQAEKEYEQLNQFARETGLKDDIQAYDFAYYAEKLKKQQFNVNDEDYKPYFEKNSVIKGLFRFLKKLFKLDFEEVKVPVWHPTVSVFHLYRKGNLIGRLYLDLEARKGKRDGAWMDEWVRLSPQYGRKNSSPCSFCVANFPLPHRIDLPPQTIRCETLFHEMGHALHHLLSRVEEPFVSRISGVEWDAVEVSLPVFRSLRHEPSVLKEFAYHYKTGKNFQHQKEMKLKS